MLGLVFIFMVDPQIKVIVQFSLFTFNLQHCLLFIFMQDITFKHNLFVILIGWPSWKNMIPRFRDSSTTSHDLIFISIDEAINCDFN